MTVLYSAKVPAIDWPRLCQDMSPNTDQALRQNDSHSMHTEYACMMMCRSNAFPDPLRRRRCTASPQSLKTTSLSRVTETEMCYEQREGTPGERCTNVIWFGFGGSDSSGNCKMELLHLRRACALLRLSVLPTNMILYSGVII